MKKTPRKTEQINIRGSEEDIGAFRILCEATGFEASEIVRDMMRAALAYIPAYCGNGRWYPPQLTPEVPKMNSAAHAADPPAADPPPCRPCSTSNASRRARSA